MVFDPQSTHPLYDWNLPIWQSMRDSIEGEDAIKAKGETYLPMKSGTAAIEDVVLQAKAYNAYMLRAEFPEIVAPTIRGSVGTMLGQPATIELPAQLEPMRERATRDGLTLEALHRRIAVELMSVGRYGLLPSIDSMGTPYLAPYVAESIRNWDVPSMEDGWVLLDESGMELDRETGKWDNIERYRECFVELGRYISRLHIKTTSGWAVEEEVGLKAPRAGQQQPLGILPFVFIDTNDLSADPEDVPLYGLAKIAIRVYRMDADYTFALHMTSEPTPVAIGFDDPAAAVKSSLAPTTVGSSKLWLLPKGGDAKYLEFSGPGLAAQATAIDNSLQRAMVFGAQLFDSKKQAESGEALSLRLGSQHATLRSVAMTSAAGLERALKNLAIWVNADPEQVKVEPNLDFADHNLTAQEITALVAGWMAGGYSRTTLFWNLQRGGIINPDRTIEQEVEEINRDAAVAVELEAKNNPDDNPDDNPSE